MNCEKCNGECLPVPMHGYIDHIDHICPNGCGVFVQQEPGYPTRKYAFFTWETNRRLDSQEKYLEKLTEPYS